MENQKKVGGEENIPVSKARKPWNAPQMTVVSIPELTEHQGNPGSDGFGPRSLS
ncbi:MAG: hypothetical protein WCQ50_03450 [Spirochaetota bacterium]